MIMPLLSAWDPAANTEGTIDPLGLYFIADALGVKMIPGVRERMRHPRFLTLTAVSAAICSEFDEETVAADQVSPAWQVFEWHVVEGLVRGIKGDERISGVPGRDKVGRAIDEKVPLSARRYLKTPAVFGFHGVYRLLARTLDVESYGRLGESGYRLLGVWRDEQDLPGFYESRSGKGADLFRLWRDAVKDALKAGAVDRSPSWQGWQRIADHLGPHDAGPKERRELAGMIVGAENGFTREIVDFLRSPLGKEAFKEVRQRNENDRVWSERPFHKAVGKEASTGLKELLQAIDAYERFSRLLQDAFDDCLFMMSSRKSRTPIATLAESQLVRKAAAELPEAFGNAADALALVGESVRFLQAFQLVAEKQPAKDWVQLLLEHHRKVQLAKPPNGKLPWVEHFDDGSYIIRPGYLRDRGGLGDDSYVHMYRLGTLWSFSSDLGLVG